MKTITLYLENYDDAVSTLDKISWNNARRYLLVWPKRSRLMTPFLDLVLIQRGCTRVGAQLGIVTQDPEVEECASQLGIAVFRSVAQANLSPWRRKRAGRRALTRQPRGAAKWSEEERPFRERLTNLEAARKTRIPAFAVGIFSVITILLFFFPWAEVSLSPAEKDQTLTLQVRASPELGAANFSGGIPAYIEKAVVEGQDQIKTSGSLAFPDSFAAGEALLTNLTEKPITVPVGVVFLTLGEPAVGFISLEEAQVSGGVGKTASVKIKSQQPGSSGNVAAGEIRAIVGSIGSNLLVENPEATVGGSDRIRPVASEEDYTALRARLVSSLEQGALQEMQAKAGEGRRLLPQTLKLEEVVEEERQPAAGQAGDLLILRMRVEYSAWTIAPDELEEMIAQVFDASLPVGFVASSDGVQILQIDDPVVSGKGAEWEVVARRRIRASWEKEEVAFAILGKTRVQGEKTLAEMFPLQSSPIIRLHPAWWPRIPLIPFQIRQVVK
ncbi:MAG: baseplate J/gp47 family protein [Anaerolineaceae bacterium]|nr:baseplate J/gp47 family protein [Anaerolineaceae bacterium]